MNKHFSTDNKNSKFNSISFFILFLVLTLTGCGKETCSYCGQEKYCDKYDILGTTRYICKDCLGDPNQSVSGNVIMTYASSLIDPELYRAINSASANYTGFSDLPINNNASDGYENYPVNPQNYSDNVPENNANPAASINTEISDNMDNNTSSSDDTASNSTDTTSGNPSASNSDPASLLSDKISNLGYTISLSEGSSSVYDLYYNNSKANITIDFSTPKKAIISKLNNAYDDDFDIACIYSNLAMLNTDDYEYSGYDVYTKAKEIGNYTYSNTNFYYIEASEAEIADGAAPLTYTISVQ